MLGGEERAEDVSTSSRRAAVRVSAQHVAQDDRALKGVLANHGVALANPNRSLTVNAAPRGAEQTVTDRTPGQIEVRHADVGSRVHRGGVVEPAVPGSITRVNALALETRTEPDLLARADVGRMQHE